MNKNANAQLRMVSAVVNFLDTNEEVISTIPRLQEKAIMLKELLEQVRTLASVKSKNLTGITKDKNSLRERINFIAVQLSSALLTYARDEENEALQELVRVSASDLTGSSANANLTVLTSLLETAESLPMESLEAYAWNAGRLDAFRKQVEQFGLQMTSPREAIAKRANITDQMYVTINATRDLLNIDIDGLMLQLADEHREMMDEYFNLRKVIYSNARLTDSSEFPDEFSAGDDDSSDGTT